MPSQECSKTLKFKNPKSRILTIKYSVYEIFCRKSKQHKGEVIRFETNLSFNLNELIKELTTKKYKLGKYKKFYIYESKERLIETLPFKDRVVLDAFVIFH